MQRCQSLEIMMCIGDARQQCCSSHHYVSTQDLWALTMCHRLSQPQGGRHVAGAGRYKGKWCMVPAHQGKGSVLEELTISFKQTCTAQRNSRATQLGAQTRTAWLSVGARRRGHLSYNLKEGFAGWRRSKGPFQAEGTVCQGPGGVTHHEGTADVWWHQPGPTSQNPHRSH